MIFNLHKKDTGYKLLTISQVREEYLTGRAMNRIAEAMLLQTQTRFDLPQPNGDTLTITNGHRGAGLTRKGEAGLVRDFRAYLQKHGLCRKASPAIYEHLCRSLVPECDVLEIVKEIYLHSDTPKGEERKVAWCNTVGIDIIDMIERAKTYGAKLF